MSQETLEGAFGKVVVDLEHPQLTELWLREPSGELSKYSVLATKLEPLPKVFRSAPFVNGSYTYVVESSQKSAQTAAARRYESRNSKGHQVSVLRASSGRAKQIQFQGIELMNATGESGPVAEDWTVGVSRSGELIWTITQHWRRGASIELSGSPALFLRPFGGYSAPLGTPNNQAGQLPNITSTVWHDPARLTGESHNFYEYSSPDLSRLFSLAPFTTQSFKDPANTAVYKLFTNFGLKSDVRLSAARETFLYRRGGQWGMFNEIGTQGSSTLAFARKMGDETRLSVTIGSVDKYTTGHHLAVDLPDKALEATLRDMYGSLLNGGTVSDNKSFHFGNQSEGVHYAGGAGWHAAAIAAGMPAPGATSSHSFTAAQALRAHLERILDAVDADGRSRFGYQGLDKQGLLDDNLHVIEGSRSYFLYSGDLAFVKKYLPTFERMVKFYSDRIDPKVGLFAGPPGAHWYYDVTRFSGFNSYINIFLWKALEDLGDLEEATAHADEASQYRAMAARLKERINAVLWNESAPGGPRYSDWVESDGSTRKEYFLDLVQWPAIALGIASEEQARKILATADSRLTELKRDLGYRDNCTVSSLWPQGPSDNVLAERFYFGRYMNGGCLLVMTYWEVVARARAGDINGAYQRLSKFSERYRQMGWVGNNGASIEGEMSSEDPSHGSGEPYLADMVVVPTSVIYGLLGIAPTLHGLQVTPHLPAGWSRTCAEILYMGVRQTVSIENGVVRIKPDNGSCRGSPASLPAS